MEKKTKKKKQERFQPTQGRVSPAKENDPGTFRQVHTISIWHIVRVSYEPKILLSCSNINSILILAIIML